MPYKNPEDKRRWEREHREQRNALRRQRSANSQSRIIIPPQESANTTEKPKQFWKTVLGLAVGVGLFFVGAGLGINTSIRK